MTHNFQQMTKPEYPNRGLKYTFDEHPLSLKHYQLSRHVYLDHVSGY